MKLVPSLVIVAGMIVVGGKAYFECDTTKTIVVRDSNAAPVYFYITLDQRNNC